MSKNILGIVLAIGLVGISGSANAQARFQGGPLDGMTADGGPSLPNASPVPSEMAAPIAAAKKAYETGNTALLARYLESPDVRIVALNEKGQPVDAPAPFVDMRFKGQCSINTPFFLKAYNQSVRLEWVCAGRLYYRSQLTVRDGKIAAMTSGRSMPVAVINR